LNTSAFYPALIALIRYQGNIGAALVLGGVDATGPHLFTIHPHGSTDKLPYVTMGSGSLAAMAVFESGWKANMEVRPLEYLKIFTQQITV
jgi:20S proteasome subunit beta 2